MFATPYTFLGGGGLTVPSSVTHASVPADFTFTNAELTAVGTTVGSSFLSINGAPLEGRQGGWRQTEDMTGRSWVTLDKSVVGVDASYPSGVHVALVYKRNIRPDTQTVVFSPTALSSYVLNAVDGDATTTTASGIGFTSYRGEGTAFTTGTRGTLWTNYFSDTDLRGVAIQDVSFTGVGDLEILHYDTGSAATFEGEVLGVAIYTDWAETDDVEAWLKAQVPALVPTGGTGFFTHNGTAQTITSSLFKPTLGVRVSDSTDTTLDNDWYVPLAENGKYYVFQTGFDAVTNSNYHIHNLRWTPSGGSEEQLVEGRCWTGAPSCVSNSGPRLVSTDDVFSCRINRNSTDFDTAGDTRTFFSGYPLDTFHGFYVWWSAQTSIGSGFIVPPWDMEDYDTDNAISSGVYTVPASRDGQYMIFSGCLCARGGFGSSGNISRIEIDSGLGYTVVAESGNISFGTVITPPIQVSTGDLVRFRIERDGLRNYGNSRSSFFAGYVANPSGAHKGFYVRKSGADEAITAGSDVVPTWNTEVYDTETAFSSGEFTVPSSINGEYLSFSLGHRDAGTGLGNVDLKLQKWNGSSWDTLFVKGEGSATNRAIGATFQSPALLMETGDRYRMVINTSTSGNLVGDERTFFAGHVV